MSELKALVKQAKLLERAHTLLAMHVYDNADCIEAFVRALIGLAEENPTHGRMALADALRGARDTRGNVLTVIAQHIGAIEEIHAVGDASSALLDELLE